MEVDKLITGLKKGNRVDQKKLYDTYAPLFMSIGIRYLKNVEEAEDALAEAFIKIFTKITTYKNEGSFEGWIKRIMINECLMKIRKNKRNFLHLPLEDVEISIEPEALDRLNVEEIMQTIAELPEGYRTIFNLYAIEGYKHREIAEILNISIHTSKSQLIMAKKKLQGILKKNQSANTKKSM